MNVLNGPSVSSGKIVAGSDVMEVRSGLAGSPQNAMNLARPPAHQQVSPPSDEVGNVPQPIQAPRDHRPIRTNAKNDETVPDEQLSDVGFEQDGGGVVVPVGPRVVEEGEGEGVGEEEEIEGEGVEVLGDNVLPMPYNFREGKEKVAGKIAFENIGESPVKLGDKNSENLNKISPDDEARNVNHRGANRDDNNVLAVPYPAEKSSSLASPRLD